MNDGRGLRLQRVLAVVPARGGSKGIPRKNLRLMHGRPLISYAIDNALSCRYITDCVVSTDDAEIARVAEYFGSQVVRRGEKLSTDAVTLDPVIYDAVLQMEARAGEKYDIIVTLQPTSPLLTVGTLTAALEQFCNDDDLDSMLSVVNQPHLSWKLEQGRFVPDYKVRLNRQHLPPRYLETGAFLFTRRHLLTESGRLGNKVSVYEVPIREATDIDSVADWIVSESILSMKRIILRADGMKSRGMGHIYNCIAMAFGLIGHDVLLVTRADCMEGLAKIRSYNLPYKAINDDAELEGIIRSFHPDIWVNDCLNTTTEYIDWLKERVPRVVSIEDLGRGAERADAVINALYENHKGLDGRFFEGPDYVLLRDEFMLETAQPFREKARHVLIMFGGTDPENLNRKAYLAVKQIAPLCPQVSFDFVTGLGYDAEANGIVDDDKCHIKVYRDVARVTEFMKKADVAVTSQGRTVYEIASMGVPGIVISQNERETTHLFATMKNGFLNLGLGHDVEPVAVANTIKWLLDTPNIRRNMRSLMLRHDFRGNGERIRRIILGE